MPSKEHHRIFRSNWLRAAVLGANDGIVSTASLITGVAAAQAAHEVVLTSGLAGLVAGALSMAAGEYVSVRSQSDIEAADLRMEQRSLKRNSGEELEELIEIYVERGLSRDLAEQVARQLTRHDALDAHARDELGISMHNRARPMQAAVASAASFAGGAALPLVVAALVPGAPLIG
ncbi:membrane protein, partial [Achromobacter xylosoxidans C54]|uniref:VIT1/CCC1 transporter family protein n=1 Tax=Alcaligenes xylosoxydans xylosoxydans TaxID=85698 RepID=UPI0001F42D3A